MVDFVVLIHMSLLLFVKGEGFRVKAEEWLSIWKDRVFVNLITFVDTDVYFNSKHLQVKGRNQDLDQHWRCDIHRPGNPVWWGWQWCDSMLNSTGTCPWHMCFFKNVFFRYVTWTSNYNDPPLPSDFAHVLHVFLRDISCSMPMLSPSSGWPQQEVKIDSTTVIPADLYWTMLKAGDRAKPLGPESR